MFSLTSKKMIFELFSIPLIWSSAVPSHVKEFEQGRIVQLVVHLTQEPEVPGSILGLATYSRTSMAQHLWDHEIYFETGVVRGLIIAPDQEA